MPNTVIIDVDALVRRAELKPGDSIGDLGTGREGRLAIAAGRVVGEAGTVYAVDVVKSILPLVVTKAQMHGVHNIQTVWSDLERYGAARTIADNSLAAAFMITVLFQSTKRPDMLREAVRMLRPTGKLIVVDWKPDVTTPFGPEPSRRVYPAEIIQYAENEHLQLLDQFDAGAYHWGLLFVK